MVQRSLTSIIREIEVQLDDVKTVFLQKIAETLVGNSPQETPVDTGAYITSHSITSGSGSGRSRVSRGKTRGQDWGSKASESLGQLMADIAGLPKDSTKTYITNRSPHNKLVEFGGTTTRPWRNGGYHVFSRTITAAPMLMAEAIREVSQ